MRQQRKIVNENGRFMVLKPYGHDGSWERIGRRYDDRGIMNCLINTAKAIDFDIDDLSPEDRVYVSEYIKKGLST